MPTFHASDPTVQTPRAARPRKPRLKHSYYLATVNSNSKDDSEEGKRRLAENIRASFMDQDWVEARILNRADGPIEKIEIIPGIEVGDSRGMLHAHVAIKISHRSNVKLDYEGIKKWWDDAGYPYVYIRFQAQPTTWGDNIGEYAQKGAAGAE